MPTRRSGHYQQLADKRYFVPYPLPPNPPLEWSPALLQRFSETMLHLGRLDEAIARIPDAQRFLQAFVMKESLLSSEIEGIHTTLIELFDSDTHRPRSETRRVANYMVALDGALQLMRMEGLPLVERVIKHCHSALLEGTVESGKSPGVYRSVPVRVGQLVPPPAHQLDGLMKDLEQFINGDDELPGLIKAGMAHAQFEIIHPFLDGNGRTGRMLIVLILVQEGILSEPLFYPSLFLVEQRQQYYQALDGIRTHGDWESWILFFLEAVGVGAEDALVRAKAIERLQSDLLFRIQSSSMSTSMKMAAKHVLERMFEHPILTIADAAEWSQRSYNSAKKLMDDFVEMDFVHQQSSRSRNKKFGFTPYLHLLDADRSELSPPL